MELNLVRTRQSGKATIGELFVDGAFECYTLEDVVRVDDPSTPADEGKKVWGATAIPAGRYKVIINLSPKFGKLMLRVMDVPGFTGILIHGGNTAEDTLGCILVGDKVDGDHIVSGTSTPAINRLFAKVKNHLNRGIYVWLTIENRIGMN